MQTVQMTLDEALVREIDEVASALGTTPSAFAIDALRQALARLRKAGTEIREDEWLRAAATNPAFEDLNDPEEDVYSPTDGIPFRDQV